MNASQNAAPALMLHDTSVGWFRGMLVSVDAEGNVLLNARVLAEIDGSVEFGPGVDERIVECWNACAGVESPSAGALAESRKLVAELVAALDALAREATAGNIAGPTIGRAWDALARAKAVQP